MLNFGGMDNNNKNFSNININNIFNNNMLANNQNQLNQMKKMIMFQQNMLNMMNYNMNMMNNMNNFAQPQINKNNVNNNNNQIQNQNNNNKNFNPFTTNMNTKLKLNNDMPMNNFQQQINQNNNINFLMQKFNMMNQGKKISNDNPNGSQNNPNTNQMNQTNQMNNNNNFNQNNQNNQNSQFNQMNNNNSFNNFNQNQDINQKSNELYIKLQQKNFSSPPNFINSLTKDTANISPQNKSLLENILKTVKINLITPLELIYKEQYDLSQKTTKEPEKCPICFCEFYDDINPDNNNFILQNISIYINHEINAVKLNRCEDHFYHIECLNDLIKNNNAGGFKCAVCQKIYGILYGTMPDGNMSARIDKYKRCSGFPHDKTIIISYYIPHGKQKGKYFSGTSRTCYLPNNKEGREVLALLKIAFDRTLTFVVGTSVTTGQKNTVVWNGIHHKTSLTGGTNYYGYPDPTYFNRVKEELASKGVIADDFQSHELEKIARDLLGQ